VAQQDLIDEIKETRPLSVVMAEKVNDLRDSQANRTVSSD